MGKNSTTTKIGMTEAGDAGRDFAWYNKLTADPSLAGAILITKYSQDPEFQRLAQDMNINHKPCIIHAGITGWGKTAMEPGNETPETVMRSIRGFIDRGFPAERLVLRVDPIIPTREGLEKAKSVLRLAHEIIPDMTRVRISIYDDYHASRAEMTRRGYEPIDNITKFKSEIERRPTKEQIQRVAGALIAVSPNQKFECCAEPEIADFMPDIFTWSGCLSRKDCELMNIPVPAGIGINGQHRFGCRCLLMKTELLSNKRRCPNNCAYCYWGRN